MLVIVTLLCFILICLNHLWQTEVANILAQILHSVLRVKVAFGNIPHL